MDNVVEAVPNALEPSHQVFLYGGSLNSKARLDGRPHAIGNSGGCKADSSLRHDAAREVRQGSVIGGLANAVRKIGDPIDNPGLDVRSASAGDAIQ
jgi:hypothetical protein